MSDRSSKVSSKVFRRSSVKVSNKVTKQRVIKSGLAPCPVCPQLLWAEKNGVPLKDCVTKLEREKDHLDETRIHVQYLKSPTIAKLEISKMREEKRKARDASYKASLHPQSSSSHSSSSSSSSVSPASLNPVSGGGGGGGEWGGC